MPLRRFRIILGLVLAAGVVTGGPVTPWARKPLLAQAADPGRLPELPPETPSELPVGLAGKAGRPSAGRELFGRHCQLCHRADELAGRLYASGAESSRSDACVFLQNHGLTDATQDCDIVAYLKAIARPPAP